MVRQMAARMLPLTYALQIYCTKCHLKHQMRLRYDCQRAEACNERSELIARSNAGNSSLLCLPLSQGKQRSHVRDILQAF